MKRVVKFALAAGGLALLAGAANSQSLGGFPIREPGQKGTGHTGGGGTGTKSKGLQQIVVDANGNGPYKSISKAIENVAEGGTIYVMHGDYEESLKLTKSVIIQGDRGPGEGVNISAPKDEPCLAFTPKEGANANAIVANVSFTAAGFKSSGSPCVHVAGGSFTLKESDVLGSSLAAAIKISGGNIRLEKNVVSGGQQGIAIAQNHALSDAYIVNNKISGNDVGIDIAKETRADVYITDNEIFDNLKIGVNAAGYGSANLTGNKIRNNRGLGVFLDSRTRLSYVRHNEIVRNQGDGISIPFGNNGIIEDNTIAGNDGMGVFCRTGYGPLPKIDNSNVIEGNKGDKKSKRPVPTCVSKERAKPRT